MKLAVSGCPRNCAESLCKDVGIVAIEGGRWEIYIGGAAGAHIRKGDLLATVDSPEEVMTLTGRFLQYYRENANWLERTYDFVPRVGLEHLRWRIQLAGALDVGTEVRRGRDAVVGRGGGETGDPVAPPLRRLPYDDEPPDRVRTSPCTERMTEKVPVTPTKFMSGPKPPASGSARPRRPRAGRSASSPRAAGSGS